MKHTINHGKYGPSISSSKAKVSKSTIHGARNNYKERTYYESKPDEDAVEEEEEEDELDSASTSLFATSKQPPTCATPLTEWQFKQKL